MVRSGDVAICSFCFSTCLCPVIALFWLLQLRPVRRTYHSALPLAALCPACPPIGCPVPIRCVAPATLRMLLQPQGHLWKRGGGGALGTTAWKEHVFVQRPGWLLYYHQRDCRWD